jgi:alkylhydroperoxidase family enzyme
MTNTALKLNQILRRTFAIALICVPTSVWMPLRLDADETVQKAVASKEPKVIPQNRQEMKQLLNDLKNRKSRLPLPAKGEETAAANGRPVVNNGLARRTYLPESWYGADFNNDPAMTLTYVFKTQCFWVVSRGNNCHYCLGHQEHKLHAAGLSDREIALLDYDWEKLDPMVRKGAELAKRMTLSPHLINASDIEKLRPELSDAQIIELVYTIAMFNSVNRWTDALGLPQDDRMRDQNIDFLTPVDDEFQNRVGGIAAAAVGEPERMLPSFEEAIANMKAAVTRQPRVELPSEDAARKMLGDDAQGAIEDWERALATFPEVGKRQWNAFRAMESDGHVDQRVKAIIAWTTARHNRSAVSLVKATQRWASLGVTESGIKGMEQGETLSDVEKLVATFAAKLTNHPQRITDADIQALRDVYSDQQVAEIVYLIAAANMFDRFTETLGCAARVE